MSVLSASPTLYRWRITFGVDGPLIYYSVLDMGRMWERLLRRAKVPIAYTQGFHPHPRMQFAAALPVGYSSECELVDIYLTRRIGQDALRGRVESQGPYGLTILDVEAVPLKARLPQSAMRKAVYRVLLETDAGADRVAHAANELLDKTTIVRQRSKRKRIVDYDLRALIYDIRLRESCEGMHTLEMVVKCGPQGAGRPEEIIDELGLHTVGYGIHRERLVWEDGEEGTT